jgi:hypothetical protein
MPIYLINVHRRKHQDLFGRQNDAPLRAFFDLDLSGHEAEMVPHIETEEECIVASYAPGAGNVVFKTYRFANFAERPIRGEEHGRLYRVFLGRLVDESTPMTKHNAMRIVRYQQFFDTRGHFKRRSAFQR